MLPVKENSDEGRISVNSGNSANSRRDISAPPAEHFHGTGTPSPCLPGSEQTNGQGPASALAGVNGMTNGRAQPSAGQRMPVSAFAARAGMPDASLSAKQMQMAMGGAQPAGAVPSIPAL